MIKINTTTIIPRNSHANKIIRNWKIVVVCVIFTEISLKNSLQLTLHNCWPADNSSNGWRVKQREHANNKGALIFIILRFERKLNEPYCKICQAKRRTQTTPKICNVKHNTSFNHESRTTLSSCPTSDYQSKFIKH